MDLEAIKQRQARVWGLGDYSALSRRLAPAAQVLCDACAVSAGQEVLDVAAGDGNFALASAREGASVVACDISPGMVERGRARSEAEGYAVEWIEADAEELPFEDARFDCVGSAFGAFIALRADDGGGAPGASAGALRGAARADGRADRAPQRGGGRLAAARGRVRGDPGAPARVAPWPRACCSSTTARSSRAGRASPACARSRERSRRRSYRYRVLTRQERSPFERERALWWPRPLDRAALAACAAALPGRHDFTAFTPSDSDHVRFERDVLRAAWVEESEHVLAFVIEADTFMRNMVRV